jgi:glycine/D-amino acid oxidase-like deaminating enzyme
MAGARRGGIPNRDFRPHPVWWDDCPPTEEPEAPLPQRCDVAIVGGGYAGLSAALELARNGASVAVLEADAFGYHASGRNSGGVSFGLDLARVARWRRWTGSRGGPDAAALARGAVESFTHMENFVRENAIECDYRRAGRLVCAPTPAHYSALARRADALNRLFGADARVLPRAQQAEEIGSERFHGVLVIERSGQLNPARLLRALVALCHKAKVSLHSRTQVARIERAGGGFEIGTAGRGMLRADKAIVATNAQAAGLGAAELGRRIIPVASNIIVTEPLPVGVAEALLPRGRTGADDRRMLAYFRRTPDGRRFLYGSRAAPFDVTPARSARVLYRRMLRSFPQLDGVRISHAWGCRVAFTPDALPHMGEIDGIAYLSGCNGNGVAMMNYLGHRLARKILDGGRTDCVFDGSAFPKLPLYGGYPWFLPAVAAAYRMLDGLDELKARAA